MGVVASGAVKAFIMLIYYYKILQF